MRPIGIVHDEIQISLPEDRVERVNKILTSIWHIRHDDEVWCGELCIGQAAEPEIAAEVVKRHNETITFLQITKGLNIADVENWNIPIRKG
jgi:hypothetical protein